MQRHFWRIQELLAGLQFCLHLDFGFGFGSFVCRGDAKSLGVELRIRSPFPELGHSLAIFLPDYGHSR